MNAWVLAGGLSRRLGRDKAMVPVDGVPVVLRTVAILRAAGLEPRVLGREARGLPVPEVAEPDGPRHPAWGVAFALAQGEAFFAPCDLPDLTEAAVRALLEARAVAVDQPLLGVYPASLAEAARACAEAGGPMRTLVAGLPALDVGRFRNLNRPEDLEG